MKKTVVIMSLLMLIAGCADNVIRVPPPYSGTMPIVKDDDPKK